MDDETFVRFTADHVPREDLQRLMTRSNGPALGRAVWHFGALAVTGALLWRLRGSPWALPVLVAHAYVLVFVFCALHECAHRTAFRTRWLNALVGHLAGFLTFWPYRNYRVYHWEHHRHTQDPSRDPELYVPKPASPVAYMLVLTGIPNAIRRVGDILRLAAGIADRPWMAPSERGRLVIEARLYLLGYALAAAASVMSGTAVALLVWIAPWILGQAFLRPYLLAEHTGCGATRDCLENTRTTLSVALVRLFAWNMPYHAEHHAYPAIPFHALPRLHALVGRRLEHVEPGYVAATVTVNRYLFRPPAPASGRAQSAD
jgi:fatty acid desaturase